MAYEDITRYFSRPRGIANNQRYNIEWDPNTGTLRGKMYRTGKFGDIYDEFDPSKLNFYGDKFAQKYGLEMSAPGGESLFGRGSTWSDMVSSVKSAYGTSLSKLVTMSPDTRSALYSSKRDDSGLFDPDTGLPTRPPKTQEEAIEWQWRAGEWARRKNEEMLQNAIQASKGAIAATRYGLGMVTKGGPYSAASMMSPLLGQMAGAYNQMGGRYMQMQYDQPDYSYFLRGGPGGGGITMRSSRLLGLGGQRDQGSPFEDYQTWGAYDYSPWSGGHAGTPGTGGVNSGSLIGFQEPGTNPYQGIPNLNRDMYDAILGMGPMNPPPEQQQGGGINWWDVLKGGAYGGLLGSGAGDTGGLISPQGG